MAGDWIKIRTDLLTSPKVVRIASALKTDRFRAAGGLLGVWSLFDAHSEDGVLAGYTLAAIDDSIGWKGFARAMAGVDWLIEDETGLSLPRFDEHNGASAKRRAQEAQRKRTERGQKDGQPSASDADKLRSREEKRREELKTKQSLSQKQPHAASLLPDVEPQIAADWQALRAKKRAPITKTAVDGIRSEALKAGLSLQEALAVCCRKGWAGFEASWDRGSNGATSSGMSKQEALEEKNRANAAAWKPPELRTIGEH